jgi:hypothetical protein
MSQPADFEEASKKRIRLDESSDGAAEAGAVAGASATKVVFGQDGGAAEAGAGDGAASADAGAEAEAAVEKAEGIFAPIDPIAPNSAFESAPASVLLQKALQLLGLLSFLVTIPEMLCDIQEPIMAVRGVLMPVLSGCKVCFHLVMRSSGRVYEILDMQRAMPFLEQLNYTSFDNNVVTEYNSAPHASSDPEALEYVLEYWDFIRKILKMTCFINNNSNLVVDEGSFSYDMVRVKCTSKDGTGTVYITIQKSDDDDDDDDCGGLVCKIIDAEEEEGIGEIHNVFYVDASYIKIYNNRFRS